MASKVRVAVLFALYLALTYLTEPVYNFFNWLTPFPSTICVILILGSLVWGFIESIRLIKEKELAWGITFLILNVAFLAFCLQAIGTLF